MPKMRKDGLVEDMWRAYSQCVFPGTVPVFRPEAQPAGTVASRKCCLTYHVLRCVVYIYKRFPMRVLSGGGVIEPLPNSALMFISMDLGNLSMGWFRGIAVLCSLCMWCTSVFGVTRGSLPLKRVLPVCALESTQGGVCNQIVRCSQVLLVKGHEWAGSSPIYPFIGTI